MEKKKSAEALLQEAYLKLLTKKSYLDVSVTDLVKEAGVARVSYYRLFDSFDDLVDKILDNAFKILTDNVFPQIEKMSDETWQQTIERIFYKFKKNEYPFSLPKLLPQNLNYICSKAEEKITNANFNGGKKSRKYIFAVNASIVIALAKTWALNGFKESERDLSNLAVKLVKNNIDAVKEFSIG